MTLTSQIGLAIKEAAPAVGGYRVCKRKGLPILLLREALVPKPHISHRQPKPEIPDLQMASFSAIGVDDWNGTSKLYTLLTKTINSNKANQFMRSRLQEKISQLLAALNTSTTELKQIANLLRAYFMTRPIKSRLHSKAPGWKYDLPGPNQPPDEEPYPPVMPNPPNKCNDVFLEIPRNTLKARGLIVFVVILFLPACFAAPALWMAHVIWLGKIPDFIAHLVLLSILISSVWGLVYFWKMDMQAPLDEPIRFNRARRKIYVYRFRSNGLKLFDRNEWGVSVETYDWDNLRAEFCSIYGPMGTGGLIETINLAVEHPDTHEVLQRFHFAHDSQQGKMYWALAQLFMQQGPQALPTFDRTPRDWNNEIHTFNLARRFAPKVQWPADIDLESRTAPSPPDLFPTHTETHL